MLTRIRINGFKNLVGVDVRFGPFTCIAGPNAAGKSNLFDAIRFLSALANETVMKAALSVRSQDARNADVTSLFHKYGGKTTERMSFEVEMITPQEAIDDLGQTAQATANFLRYNLELKLSQNPDVISAARGPIEIVKEELTHIQTSKIGRHIAFPHTAGKWRDSAIKIKHRTAPFISTEGDAEQRVIKLHQDGGSRGRAISSNPATQPRTVLSVANAAECPTALCAKREMESWQLLQLEPAALREPDAVNAAFHMSATGAHLPATLYHLGNQTPTKGGDSVSIYARTAIRLGELIDDIKAINVDRDDKRELLTLQVTAKDGAIYPARSLSDGTLRFLALTVLEMDPHAKGVVCLEEPENGIHPERIPAMLELLRDIATDPDEVVDDTNPLRQVIVNTHSPAVVLEVPDDTLLVVDTKGIAGSEIGGRRAVFSFLPDTWREKADPQGKVVPKGRLLAYLNPVPSKDAAWNGFYAKLGRQSLADQKARPRIADRDDLQQKFSLVAE